MGLDLLLAKDSEIVDFREICTEGMNCLFSMIFVLPFHF